MIYGDQWLCPCGWHNVFVRRRCRNCGEAQLPVEQLQSFEEVLMQHARGDYQNIQEITTNGTTRRIPADEPVFLIRGQDVAGGDAVRAWADLAEVTGADPTLLARAREQAAKMDAWPKKKVADLPAGQQQ